MKKYEGDARKKNLKTRKTTGPLQMKLMPELSPKSRGKKIGNKPAWASTSNTEGKLQDGPGTIGKEAGETKKKKNHPSRHQPNQRELPSQGKLTLQIKKKKRGPQKEGWNPSTASQKQQRRKEGRRGEKEGNSLARP